MYNRLKCFKCGFELFVPIAKSVFNISSLGLYDDNRYPGRCILMFSDHEEDFAEMTTVNTLMFIKDMQIAAKAIKQATGANRINYAILGNAVPHVHAHLIPRYGTDPVPSKSPWNHPNDAKPLNIELRKKIINNIYTELKNCEKK